MNRSAGRRHPREDMAILPACLHRRATEECLNHRQYGDEQERLWFELEADPVPRMNSFPIRLRQPKMAAPANVTAKAAESLQCRGQNTMDEGAFDMVACVRRVRQRDEAAAREFMDRLYPLILKVVRSHLPQRMAEEDLVQTIFMKVFANLNQFAGQVPVAHWVSRIAVNTCLNALKAEKARPELRWADLSEETQHVVESLAADEPDERAMHGGVARELLHKLLAGLNAADRLVVTLLHLEEKSVAEVRALTGWSAPVVKVRAFRARKKLQKLLSQLETRHERV